MRNLLLVVGLPIILAGCAKSALSRAARKGNLEQVTDLIAEGVDDVNRRDIYFWSEPSGATPITVAAAKGHLAVVQALLDAGANIESKHWVESALAQALLQQHVDVAKLLLDRGAEAWPVLVGLNSMILRNPGGYSVKEQAARSLLFKLAPHLDKSRPVVVANAPRVHSSPKLQLLPSFSEADRLDDYAVIIGVEDYADLPAATYAERDATATKSFIRALGVPERNIVLLTGNRATKNGFEKTIEGWLPNNVSEKSRVFIYYSGHGAPDTKTGDAYLVPLDGDPQYLVQTGYPLKRLYSKLGQLKAKSVLIALDSCFSGAGGRSVLAKGTRPLVGKVDMAVEAQGKISVLSASAGDQISGTNEDAGYGLFTYSLLQGLNGAAKDAQGRVTLESLYGYIKPRVQDNARRGNRDQTPQLQNGGENILLRAK